jgi:hypothetical protein
MGATFIPSTTLMQASSKSTSLMVLLSISAGD